MKKTLHLLCSVLLITSFHSYGSDSNNNTNESLIELINGTKVPKTYKPIINDLFKELAQGRLPNIDGFDLIMMLFRRCKDKEYELYSTPTKWAEKYSLHPENDAPHACNILNAILTGDRASWAFDEKRMDWFLIDSYKHLNIRFPIKNKIKDLKKD